MIKKSLERATAFGFDASGRAEAIITKTFDVELMKQAILANQEQA